MAINDWFDENPPPEGREQDPYAPPGYTVPIGAAPPPEDVVPTPTPTPTSTPTSTPAPGPTYDPRFPAPNIPNPRDYPAPTPPGYGAAPLVPPLVDLPDPLAPWTGTFQAPTKDSIFNDPEFQARMENGIRTIQRLAASKGTLLTGGTVRGAEDYGQQEAGKAYGNAYNRAYNEYDTRRTDFLNNEANRFNSAKSNALDKFGMESNIFAMNRANRGDTFGFDQGIWNDLNTNRLNSWNIGSDYYQMGRTNRMDDFGIYHASDLANWQKQMDLASLGRPSAPNVG